MIFQFQSHNKKHQLRTLFMAAVLLVFVLFASCTREDSSYDIAVFIPGVTEGSPTYAMLADGVKKAVAQRENSTASIIEGGFNQGEWQQKVKALAASGDWDLIVTSNPALPEICDAVSREFPDQKFLILDGILEGNPSIYTFRYHQSQQGYLAGSFAALVSSSSMEGATDEKKIGLIIGQEYPDMNRSIRPGFEKGVHSILPEAEIEYRVVGNWFDASKAADLAGDLYDNGVDVILTIAGGAMQGVVTEARERGRYVIWFDTDGYTIAPGTIIGSTAISQERAAYEKTLQAIDGKLPFGEVEYGTVAEGWIHFVDENELFSQYVPETIAREMKKISQGLKTGKPNLPIMEER